MLSSFNNVRLSNSMDCSPPGSSVHGILQARILEWIAIPFSGIFPTQGMSWFLLRLLQWQVGSLPLAPPGKPPNVPLCVSNFQVYIIRTNHDPEPKSSIERSLVEVSTENLHQKFNYAKRNYAMHSMVLTKSSFP